MVGNWRAVGLCPRLLHCRTGHTLLALCTADEEPLSALGYNRYNLNYEDRMRFEHECIRFYCDMLPHLRFPVSYELATRAGSLFIAPRCGTGLDFIDEDKRFGGHDKARLFTEMARTYEALGSPCVKKTFCRNKERRDVRSHKNLQGVSV